LNIEEVVKRFDYGDR